MKNLSDRVQELVETGEIQRLGIPYYERQDFIVYYLKGWIEEYKRADSWIKEVEKILNNPNCLTAFGKGLYELQLEDEQRKKATAKRHLVWLGKRYDKVTKGRIFYQPQTKGYQDLEAIKQKVSCAELAAEYLPLQKRGRNYVAICPFHKEKSPSFTVYPNGFKCFGCGWNGDVFKFVMDMDKCDFKEALKKLNV